ncbi:glycosyltransferase family 2 protein [Lamprobacter modestohalophilus]|uniref:glycosyltransferase family 2 protein n=1 Tax=Lamprobacter modestohalophilus TaxID=1064514 RepID=UPI002ADECB0E|nr:glycosyltransferase family 2 protein [Lamprobacter modestohalophilus]MEA1052134.1 glycosyltransferase family 2 protein [Lamprobacter modestohalophilus]
MPDFSFKRLLPPGWRWWRRARMRARQHQAARQLAESPDFDAAFYLAQAPDVAASPRWSAQPALHYLLFGGSEGRRPSNRFDSRWYLEQYPDVQAAGMNPLLHFLRHGYGEGRLPRALRAMTWHERLWSSATPEEEALARQELERLLKPAEDNDQEASAAAWSLGRWYAWLEQWTDAARVMAHFRRIAQPLPGHLAPHLLDLDALIRIEALTNAQARLDALLERSPNHPDLCLVAANLLGAQARAQGQPAPMHAQLEWINRPYLAQGLETLHIMPDLHGMNDPYVLERKPGPDPELAPEIETKTGLSIDRLHTQAGPTSQPKHRAKHRLRHQRETPARQKQRWPRWFAQSTHDKARSEREQPLVSIIVPAWNAAATVHTALESLAQQTWEAIEVIVVDDCSSDGTDAVIDRFTQRDPRFRLLRLPTNQGAYVARNTGLAAARGDFITTHDGDDWSHPQKIERQLQPLLASDALMATVSHWVRASSDLRFGQWSTHEGWMGWVHRNVSSLLFRRSVFEQLGYWDRVKVSADTEYYYRLIKAFGAECIAEVLPGIPLSFARHHPTSLTQHAETSLRSVFSGARKAYQDAASQWHANASGPADLYLPACPGKRPFPAPTILCNTYSQK